MWVIISSFFAGLWSRIGGYVVAAAGGAAAVALLLLRAFTEGENAEKAKEAKNQVAAIKKESEDVAKANAAADVIRNQPAAGGLHDDDGFKRK